MKKPQHLPPSIQQQQIRESIAFQGFALQHVLASEKEPAFSYTIGLHTPGSQRPELFISGLRVETRVAWLLDLGFRLQGPPPLATRQQLARARGISLHALTFPAGGAVFEPGKRYPDFSHTGLPACFAAVAPEQYETHLGQALVFHGSASFPVLQLIWPDTQGRFPWEEGFEQRFVGKQRLLCDPPHPLR